MIFDALSGVLLIPALSACLLAVLPGTGGRFYARVEAGDALFVPSKTWHCVVALEPSISLAVFGLTPSEIIIGGGASTARHALHAMHLYRWGNCTCHKMKPAEKLSM